MHTISAHWIVVSNEVGLGLVPGTALGRAYHDTLGPVNARVASAADRVELLVAGLPCVRNDAFMNGRQTKVGTHMRGEPRLDG